MKKNKGRIFVAMSGGVDSSVSAALLKKEGHDVTGVFMKVWQPDFLPCTWEEERRDALRVAAHLNIPLLTWDFEKEYKEYVADYMIREYRAGRTPNPDVLCNKEVKFGAFFLRAMSEGADAVATGHYSQTKNLKLKNIDYYISSSARKLEKSTFPIRSLYVANKKEGIFTLVAGADPAKDQSYFLWTLGQEQLSKTLFPVGGYKKSQVRALAKKFKLPVAEKKDSQGLCFVGKLDMKDFLAHFMEEKEGSVVNEAGEAIGSHRGAYLYTLGERHGFMITKKGTDDAPYYIIAKDMAANTITVAHQATKPASERAELTLSRVNFCRGITPDIARTYIAQVRYHGEQYSCRLLLGGQASKLSWTLQFKKPVVVDIGQSVVLYDGEECLGGGIVEK